MNIACYIISYLPEEESVRSIRIATLSKQLSEWLANTSMNIYILAMQYYDADLLLLPISDRLHIIRSPGLKTTFAHVEVQKLFYMSKYKWAVMMDDDACLYPHNSSYNMFAEMDTHIEDYKHITCFYPHNPMVSGFNQLYIDEPRYATHHIFTPLQTAKGTLYVLKNLQLYSEEPVYNDTDFDMMDDVAFAIRLQLKGHKLYTTANLILKELPHNASFFGDNKKDDNTLRIAKAKLASKLIVHKYSGLLSETPKGITIDQTVLRHKYVVGAKKHFIPKYGIYDNTLFDWDSIRG